jgi:GNAT superfamily N-acetyltransferase
MIQPRPPDRTTALRHVLHTLSADLACDQADLLGEQTRVVAARELTGRRKFPLRASSFTMATLGRGVVISCSADRLEWAQRELGGRGRDELFDATTLVNIATRVQQDQQILVGPVLRFLCAQDSLRAIPAPDAAMITLVPREQILQLYAYQGFQNALGYRLDSPRPDVLAAVAWRDQAIVGIAGASADNDQLWQIGVDVRAEHRRSGVGTALVSRLTRATLAAGKVPYYSTLVSNLQSSNLALRVGYWLAWIDVYAQER